MLKNILFSCLMLLSISVSADNSINNSTNQLRVGSTLPSIVLKTQHNKSVKVKADVRTILFAFEKQHSALINTYLAKQNADYLSSNKAYYIADISGMPSLISKMFAIPKMKKLPYDILLARSDKQLTFIPRKKGYISVIKVKEGKFASVMFVNKPAQLQSVFR